MNGTPSRDRLPEFASSHPNHEADAYSSTTPSPKMRYSFLNIINRARAD